MEYEVISKSLPIIQDNFELVKANLVETMEKYKGFIVTEESLSLCKQTQKELAGNKKKVDAYRLEIKKEMSKPITDFEDKCKQLIKIIEDAEKPIKEGIQVFDDKKRESNKQIALKLIKEAIETLSLLDKYSIQLTVLDKYMNLTAKEKDIAEDIQDRAEALKQKQTTELDMLEIIKDTIENANKNINAKMSLADFQRSINAGVSTKEIMNDINTRAERIKKSEIEAEELRIKKENEAAELKVKKELEAKLAEEERQRLASMPKEEVKEEVSEVVTPVKVEPSEEYYSSPSSNTILKDIAPKQWFAEIRITGSLEDVKKVKPFLTENNMQYVVIKQGEID